jgi:hypothetical protein
VSESILPSHQRAQPEFHTLFYARPKFKNHTGRPLPIGKSTLGALDANGFFESSLLNSPPGRIQ